MRLLGADVGSKLQTRNSMSRRSIPSPSAWVSGLIASRTSYATRFGVATILSLAFLALLWPMAKRSTDPRLDPEPRKKRNLQVRRDPPRRSRCLPEDVGRKFQRHP
jgi:hypothetical protein